MVLDGNQEYLVGEFAEEYQLGRMGRREMLRRVLLVTGGVASTAAVLRGLGVGAEGVEASGRPPVITIPANVSPSAMRAAQQDEPGAATSPPPQTSTAPVVSPDDRAIIADAVQFPGQAGTLFGYIARPNRQTLVAERYPAVLIIHENRGLIEPAPDIARRYAKEGFIALALDLASRAGGTGAFADDPMAITGALGALSMDDLTADMTSAIDFLKSDPAVDSARGFGVTGFCYGGNQAFLLARRNPDIRAAVPYYGTTDAEALAANTRAAVLAFYGELDTRVTAQQPGVVAAMSAAGKLVQTVIYPETGHAFFNNTSPQGGPFGYNPNSARDAWRLTLAWFRAYLVA